MKPGVEFILLTTGEVLVTVTVATGEPGHSEITTTASYRISGTDFCVKALPIIWQNYSGDWPPPAPPGHAPVDELPPPK